MKQNNTTLNYLRKASLMFKTEGNMETSVNHNSIFEPYKHPKINKGSPRLSEKYPDLMNELNDSESPMPAFVRFQKQENSVLRDDLKQLKAEHFRINYKRTL